MLLLLYKHNIILTHNNTYITFLLYSNLKEGALQLLLDALSHESFSGLVELM